MSRICIVQVIYLCAWATLMDTLVGILMDLMGFMEGIGHRSVEAGRKNVIRVLYGKRCSIRSSSMCT